MTNSATPTDDAHPEATPGEPGEGEPVERGQLVTSGPGEGGGETGGAEPADGRDMVTSPAKVMRIGSMVKSLLEEVRSSTSLDEPSRERLAEIFERSVVELSEALSPDLREELQMLTLPFKDGEVPSESEIRVAKAQLVGWLEGLFHGIQATLFAQQLAARQQLEQIRQLPPGAGGPGGPGMPGMPGQQPPPESGERPGTYL